MTSPAAGWYPDPAGSGKLRYWNGFAWTVHVSPPDPPAEPEPAPQPTPAPTLVLPEPAPSTGAAVGSDAPVTSSVAPQPAPPSGGDPTGGPPHLGAIPPPTGLPLGYPPAAAAVAQRLGPDGQVLSGWWRRFFGYAIDAVVISIVGLIILAIVGAVTGGFGDLIDTQAWSDLLAKAEANPGYQPSEAELQRLLGSGLVSFLAWLSVISLGLSFLNGVLLVALSGQTIGDRVVGTRKVMAGRTVPGFGPATLRWVIPAILSALQVVPLIGVVALMAWILDYLWPLWDQRRQALHDKAARTYVERSALAGPVNR